ncbi:MAG: signal peptide peptidase SppA [Chloroflexia bacterium]|nr:signal peptide peptidase SppA [Chloroflexia bacterium]
MQSNDQTQPAQPRRRNRGCIWAAVIGAVFGVLALVALVVFVAAIAGTASGSAGSVQWDEQHIDGSGSNKVAVLPVSGVIGASGGGLLGSEGATPENLNSQLMQAANDDAVKAIILEVNSPGGGVVASDEMYRDILDFKETSGRPVVVSMGDTAASGGYYISMAADHVVANPATLTGSLGVILSFLNYEEAANKLGLKQVVIKSGEYKDIGSPTRDLTTEERQILQELIDETYGQFVGVIVAGRKLPEAHVRELADGRIYSGRKAKELKLVDSLGDLDDAATQAQRLAKIDGATIVRYEQSPGLLDLLSARMEPRKPEALAVLEAAGLDPTPRLQYLYRP